MFVDDKRMHKFLKTIESLGLKSAHEEDAKRENANVDGDGPMGTMLHFGSTISKKKSGRNSKKRSVKASLFYYE